MVCGLCLWLMVDDVRCTVQCVCIMVYGLWCVADVFMAYGRWCMIYGLVSGLLFMAYGLWRMVYG